MPLSIFTWSAAIDVLARAAAISRRLFILPRSVIFISMYTRARAILS
jgi:hypothetical protein